LAQLTLIPAHRSTIGAGCEAGRGGLAYVPRVSTITFLPWLLVANQFALTTLAGN